MLVNLAANLETCSDSAKPTGKSLEHHASLAWEDRKHWGESNLTKVD
jgi:hypothetical protein